MSEADLGRLIMQWAEGRAGELIAHAEAEAMDAARARLTARLTDALLEAATARLTTPRPREVSGTLPWAYGVAAATEPPAAQGAAARRGRRRPPGPHSRAGGSDRPRERRSRSALRRGGAEGAARGPRAPRGA